MPTQESSPACARDEENESNTANAVTSRVSRNALIGLLWALLFQGGTLAVGYGVLQAARVVYRWMSGLNL